MFFSVFSVMLPPGATSPPPVRVAVFSSQHVSRERLTIPCKRPHLLLLCLAGSLTHVDPAAHLRWEAESIFSSQLGATTSAW